MLYSNVYQIWPHVAQLSLAVTQYTWYIQSGLYTCLRQTGTAGVTLLKTRKSFVAFLTVIVSLYVSLALAKSNRCCDR